jgi:ribulose-phosphate 3-epimerase
MAADETGIRTHLCAEYGADLPENIANAIDMIENKLSVKFKGAFVTGNFGPVESAIGKNTLCFPRDHRISETDVYNAVCNSPDLRNIDGQILHLIPLQFLIDGTYEVRKTDGISCNTFAVRFIRVSYPDEKVGEIKRGLGAACVPSFGFFDPIYLLGSRYHKPRTTSVYIDFGKTSTRAGIWKDRGLVSRFDIETGQDEITRKISDDFNINFEDSENIKISILNSDRPSPSDGYVLADEKFPNVTRQDVWDRWAETNNQIADAILEKIKDSDFEIFITGNGTNPDNINSLILKNKGLDNVSVLDEYATVGAFGKIFQTNLKHIKLKRIRIKKSVPILPSATCWDIGNGYTYRMFESVGIKWIHFDIMDGFYTERVSGTLDDLKKIRANTRSLIQTHLMVEDPFLWCDKIAEIGSDAIVISSGTRRIIETLKKIKTFGKKCGLALHPNFDLKNLRPEILTMLDQVVVMGVIPGASGQKFLPETIGRIRTLANTKKRHGFDYELIVDGGINDENAQDCWNAGADFLISGSFLRAAPNFADALMKLLPKS